MYGGYVGQYPFVSVVRMQTALIQGGSGGIGRALLDQVLASDQFDQVVVTSRHPDQLVCSDPRVHVVALDLCADASIAKASREVADLTDRLHLVLTTAGLLKDAQQGVAPEKKLADLNRSALEQVFAVNCFGPFLWYAALAPLLKHRERLRVATLSARVGSIGDNGLGGWHSYRASKAAQNMLTKNLSLELKRTNPQSVVVGLHPGTVDTALSKPFQSGVPSDKLFTAEQSAGFLWQVLEQLTPERSGEVIAWDGQTITP